MRLEDEVKLDFSDVLLRPMVSELKSRSEVDLERTYTFKHSGKTWTGIPIIASNMDSVGTFEMARELAKHKMLTALHKFYTVDELKEFFVDFNNPDYIMLSTGIRQQDIEKLEQIKDQNIHSFFNFICLDVPNGYIEDFFNKAIQIREMFPNHTIMAGNVVTSDITETLIQHAKMDVIKVGIGPGAACTTRKLTGVGYPQLSAVIETSNAAHGVNGWICSDGGCRTPGDVAKAFCGGADFVMLGLMLAGHNESGGELVMKDTMGIDGRTFYKGSKLSMHDLSVNYPDIKDNVQMKFYGMSSEEAMKKHYGGVASHRAPEGQTLLVDYKGPVEKTVLEILGGVRSCATYIGAKKLKEMHKRATFVRVNRQQT